MLPKMPPRSGQVGFLYLPPYRVQGISVAGEQTVVQIPELDVVFDIGLCPRIALASPYVALSHAHMDHVAGLPYYFSQRMFQRMRVGTCICHPDVEEPLKAMMRSWIDLEQQRTQHEIIPLAPGQRMEIKNNIDLKAVAVGHTVPALGYAVVERRSKLREEFRELPQEELRRLKEAGTEITRELEIPLVSYTGDTEFGPYLFCDEFAKSQIVICECTFFEDDHRGRASVGKHLHVDDLAKLLKVWEAEHIVLVHLSRRTNLAWASERLREVVGEDAVNGRVHFLMDFRRNRMRYEAQQRELGG